MVILEKHLLIGLSLILNSFLLIEAKADHVKEEPINLVEFGYNVFDDVSLYRHKNNTYDIVLKFDDSDEQLCLLVSDKCKELILVAKPETIITEIEIKVDGEGEMEQLYEKEYPVYGLHTDGDKVTVNKDEIAKLSLGYGLKFNKKKHYSIKIEGVLDEQLVEVLIHYDPKICSWNKEFKLYTEK